MKKNIHQIITERYILSELKKLGIPKDLFDLNDIPIEEVDPLLESKYESDKMSIEQDDKVKYYFYDAKSTAKFEGDGPIDHKTRDFCVEMIALGKVWTKEDINLLSFRLRYSVFEYAGGYNCRHTWKTFRYKKIDPPSKSLKVKIRDLDKIKKATPN